MLTLTAHKQPRPYRTLGFLASRLNQHYSSRGHHTPAVSWAEVNGRYGDSDQEGSASEDASCTSEKTTESSDSFDNQPRIVLLDLPIEIIEHIAVSLRSPVSPVLDAAALFISGGYTDFSAARFALSPFSKVSSSIRRIVERILYRNIHLDFTGWKGRKHPSWPAASLRLLLRTLEARPDLGQYIQCAALDYQLTTESEALDFGLEHFLNLTPKLTTLLIAQCPLALWDLPLLNTLTLATTFAPGILPSILEQFPKLRNLHLRDCHIMDFALDIPAHKLQSLRLDSNHQHATTHFARALHLCSDTVHSLDLRFIGGLLLPTPSFVARMPTLPPQAGQNLRSLRLDNISVLSHVDTGYTQLLGNLPALQHLHISHHMPLVPSAFFSLPESLRTLLISEYYGVWACKVGEEDNTFMLALGSCIASRARKITRIVGSEGSSDQGEALSLGPVATATALEGIKLSIVDAEDAYVQIFFCNI